MANQIRYQVGFDIQKQGLNELKSSLQQLSKMKLSDLMKIDSSDTMGADKALQRIKEQAQNVEAALNKAFNAKLDTVNIQTFHKTLSQMGSSVEQVYSAFSKAGSIGENAFRTLSNQVLNTNVQLKQSHTLLDNMATTLANTVKWNVASSAVNSLSNSVQQAFGYVKSLDTSLNDIRIVTNKSAEQMDLFAEKANEAAQSLGKSTTDYTDAALIFYQQGLDDKEAQKRAEITLKAANVTGQSTDEVSEQLTSVWNGYKVSAEEAELYVDRLAAVGAATASDLEELSTGMSKVASAAATMGVGEDQLAAQLSTIISVTREAPETIGTSLKTIYARISDIQAGISEDGATLGNYSGKMAQFGINVLDAQGHLRDMGEVMEEIGGKWDTLNREQQVYLTQTMAGQRQYSRLLALFDNWSEYERALNTAQQAAGTLQHQQDIYMESTAAHLEVLKASIENIYNSLADTDTINGLVDGLSTVANVAGSFIDSIGGGGQLLKDLGAIGFSVFSQQIAKGINTTITNFERARDNARQFKQALQATEKWQGISGLDDFSKKLLESRKQLLELSKLMSPQQFKGAQDLLNDVTQLGNKLASLEDQDKALDVAVQKVKKMEDSWKSLDEVMNSPVGRTKIITALQEQENKFKQLSKVLKTYRENLKESTQNFDFSEAKEKLDEYIKKIESLQKQGLLDNHEKQIENLKTEWEKVKNSVDSPDFSDDMASVKMQGIASEFQAISSTIQKQTKNTRKKVQEEAQQTANSIKTQMRETKDEFDKVNSDFQKKIDEANRTKRIQNFTKLAGGIGQVAMAIEQVQNLGSIWKNDDLSTHEKMLQTVTNMTMSLPSLVSGIKDVTQALSFLTNGSTIAMGAIGGIITALTIGISVYSSYIEKQKEEHESAIKIEEEKIETEKQKQAEIEKNEELLGSLEQLDQQYKNGQITRGQLKSTVQDLIQQFGLEGKAADDLANSYLNLSSYIEEASLKQAKALKESTERQKNAAESALQLAIQDALPGLDSEKGEFSITSSLGGVDENKKILAELKKAGFEISEASGDYATGLENQYASIKATLDDGEDIVEFYEKIQKTVENIDALDLDSKTLAKSEYYEKLKKILEDLSDEYNKYKDSAERAAEAAENFAIKNDIKNDESLNFEKIQTMDEYIQKREALIKKLKQNKDLDLDDKAATERVDTYLQENFENVYDTYDKTAKKIDEVSKKFKVSTEDVKNAINGLDGQKLTAFADLDLKSIDNWESFSNILQKISEIDFSNTNALDVNTEAMKTDASDRYNFFQSLEDQVKEGKGISKTTFESLAEQQGGQQLQKYFDVMADGTRKLTGNAEEFFDIVDNLKIDKFYDVLDAIQNKVEVINQLAEKQFNYDQLDQNAFDKNVGINTGTYDYDLLQEQVDYLQTIGAAEENDLAIWKQLIEHQTMSTEQCAKIADAVHDARDKTQDLTGQSAELKAEWEQVTEVIHDALVPLDEDINTSELERLTQLYAESATQIEGLGQLFQNNRDWAEDAAEAVLRYDDAIQNLVDNYETWAQVLKQGNNVEYIRIADDLADAYADILNLADGDTLSDAFLRNAENLELLRTAAGQTEDGVEVAAEAIDAAYNQLQDAALQDIVAHLVIEDDSFQTDFQSIKSQIESWKAEGLSDIDVNAKLQNEDFINSLNTMLQKTNAGAKEAESLIEAFGFDAEVIESEPEVKRTQYESGYIEPAEYQLRSLPNGFSYAALTKPAEYKPVTGVSQTAIPGTGAVQIKSLHKKIGGNIAYQQSSNGGGAAGTTRREEKAKAKAEEESKAAEKAQKEAERAAKEAAREVEKQQKEAQRAAEKAQRQAEQAQKKAQRQAQKAQKEWERENSDTSQKDQKELIKDERDIYHDINVQLSQVDRQLQRVQKRQQRLYGKDLLANLNKQTEILEKHKKKLLEKQSIQQGDLRDQQQQLRNLGAMFDFYGNITNYMDVVAQKQNRVNQLTAEYNSLVGLYNSSTNRTYKEGISDQMDALSKELDKAKTSLSDTKKAITDYDNLRESIEDITDQVEEETQKQIEINITKFRMELEIRLEMGQAERDWNEFQRKVINHTDIIKDSDFSKLFKDANLSLQNALSYYNVNGSKGSLQTLTEQLERTKEQLDEMDRTGTSSIYGDNRQKLMEDLENDANKLMQQLGEINDYVDSIDEAYMEYIDIAKNMFDKQISDYQFISGLLEHDMDLLKLLYGQKTYDAMGKYYEKLNVNHRQELDLLRRQADYWKERWDTAQGQQDAKKFEQNYRETINKIQDEIAKSAKDLQAEFTNAVNGIFYNLESQLTGKKGLDYVDLEWELINKKADQYLDTINAAFAIQELEGKFNEALSATNTKNIKAQQAIKKLMGEQLDYLKGKQKISQYEVDYATKLLQVEQARAALEDARSAKTSMRLKRDTQGNYSYEYVADEDNILEAQQNLAATQNELYNFNKDAYKSNLEDAYAAYKDYKQKQLDLAQRIMKGEKEAEEELLLLRQQYGEIINNYAEQNQRIRINLKESAIKEYAGLYKLNESNFNTMTENEKEMLIGKLLPAWESGIQQMIDAFAGNGGFLTVCHNSFDALADITYDYQVQLRDLSRDAGRDLSQVQRGVNSVAAQFEELIIDNNELVSVMDREAEALTTLQERAHALTDEYNAVYRAAMSAVSGIHAELQAERDKAAAQAAAEAAKNASTISTTDSYFDSSYFGGGGDGIAMVGDIVTFSGQYYHDSWGRNPAGSKYSGVEGGVMIDDYSSVAYGGRASNTGDYDVHIKSADGRYPDLGWIRLSQLRGFASGGYTGSWMGDEGKIGILHQKELVLNQQDTQNILDSVNILRSLMDGINSNIMVKLSGLKSGSYNPFGNNETLEQNVHIDASFPNVNSKREIEEAFNDLVNLAAQRALRH